MLGVAGVAVRVTPLVGPLPDGYGSVVGVAGFVADAGCYAARSGRCRWAGSRPVAEW
jgi:hypothetical protein